MTDDNNNKSQAYGIEKYEGSFDQDDLGVTQIPTETIKTIKNFTQLALFTFLASCSKDWRLNAKHLATHFDCNKETIYKAIDALIAQGFLTRTQVRNKGKFVRYHYRLSLRQINKSTEPSLEKPYTVEPDTENPDAYKTENLTNKEVILKPSVDSKKSTSKPKEYKEDLLFMEFYKLYPNKQKPTIAYKAFLKHKPTPEFVAMLITDLMERIEGNWKGRDKSKIPFPATYLNGREWEGEIYDNVVSTVKKSTKYKTWDEIVGDVA